MKNKKKNSPFVESRVLMYVQKRKKNANKRKKDRRESNFLFYFFSLSLSLLFTPTIYLHYLHIKHFSLFEDSFHYLGVFHIFLYVLCKSLHRLASWLNILVHVHVKSSARLTVLYECFKGSFVYLKLYT